MANDKVVRIGGASGFWGDSAVAAPQLVRAGNLDYLVFDYLAELTMSILAGARLKKPEAGWASDFVTVAMRQVLRECVERGIRVIANAGGVNPHGCAQALTALAKEQGIAVRIAVVDGDDVMPQLPALRDAGVREIATGRELPGKVLTANAYLGALPIAKALDLGAQVVITGRCVDSAVTLGALIHEFGWPADDYDRLAQASLAGHVIECGCQATGGLFTDWALVPDWHDIGYPIIECHADGRFVCTKPPGTGGLVTPAVIAEQILYEIGDPGAYVLPDVTCDFTQVRLDQIAPHRVQVQGARGRPPTGTYKVSATYVDGFKASAHLAIIGFDAAAKARRTAEAILARTRTMFAERGWQDYTRTHIEAIGADSIYGPHGRAADAREVIMRLTVTHGSKEALELFAREIAPAGTSWSAGTTGGNLGRPSPAPAIKQYAFLIDKTRVKPALTLDGARVDVNVPAGASNHSAGSPGSAFTAPTASGANAPGCVAASGGALSVSGRSGLHTVSMNEPARPVVATSSALSDAIEVALIRVAHGRSGDKGDISNIGIVARTPALLPVLREQLTPERVKAYLAHLVKGPVVRYDLPGIHAMNFVCEQALDGGGIASLRNDPLGKGMAQILLSMPIRVPRALLT